MTHPGIDYRPGSTLVADGGTVVSVGRDPGRRPDPDDRGRPHVRPSRTPPEDNPWRDKLDVWVARGRPSPWEEPLDDIPDDYEGRIAVHNRLRLAWRHRMEHIGLEWRDYATRFVQADDGRWWFRWMQR